MTGEKVGATENILISDAEWRERLLAAPLGNANPAVVRAVAGGNPESLMPSMLKSIEDKIGLKWHRGFVNVNAYDTLKKKADALDELVRAAEEANALIINMVSDAEPETLAYYSEYKAVLKMMGNALSKAKLSVDGEEA